MPPEDIAKRLNSAKDKSTEHQILKFLLSELIPRYKHDNDLLRLVHLFECRKIEIELKVKASITEILMNTEILKHERDDIVGAISRLFTILDARKGCTDSVKRILFTQVTMVTITLPLLTSSVDLTGL